MQPCRWLTSAVAAILTAAAVAPLTAQIEDCTTRTPPCENEPPSVVITPSGGTQSGNSLGLNVTFADDVGLDTLSWRVKLNGVDVSGQFTRRVTVLYGMARGAQADGTVILAPGTNVVEASIRDIKNTERVALAEFTYTPPPTPTPYATPEVSTAPHHPGFRNVARGEGVLAHSTPAYFSLDQPRGITLFYSSGQADPRAFVQVDATDRSTAPPSRMSILVRNPGGAWMDLGGGATELFYGSGAGTTRLAASFVEAWPGTGAYLYDVVVRSWWPDGTMREAPPARVRVLVVDQRQSPAGRGWSLAGIQRVYPDTGGALVTEGNGTAWYFAKSGVSYVTPDGDFSLLTQVGGAWERRYPDGTVYAFHPDGRANHVRDRFGNQTTFGYFPDGRLRTITDPAGKEVQVGWGTVQHLSSFTDPGGRITFVGIDPSTGMLQQVRDPTYTLALSLSYDAKGRLRTHTDLDGGTYSYAYDAWGKLSADTLPLIGAEGVYQRPVVGFASLEAAVLPPAGMGTSGNPAPRVVPDSVRQRITDPRGYVTRIAVDRFGLPTRVEEPLGRTTVTSRNRHGLPEQVVEPGGVVTAYAYDDQTGNVTQAVNWETGSAVTYEYDPATHLPVRVSMGSVDLHYSYTAAGALQSLRVGTDTTFYTSDARGRVRTVTDAAKRVASMAYDPAGFQNTVSMVSPSPAGGTHTVEYVHDGYGRTVRTRSSAGDSAVVSLDSLNRVRFAVDAAGDTVTNTWSGTRLYQVRDAAGKVYTFNTNRLGWLDSEVDPQGRIRHWAYDRAGNLIGHKNHRAQVTGYAYDALGRPTFVDADVDRWFAYDPLGRWEAGWNAESRDTLFFDRLGRLERQVTVMGGRRYELRSTWRTEGVRSNLDVLSPWQRSAAWGYGPSMHLTSVSDFGGGTTQLSQYNRVGQPGRATFPGGTLLQQFAYDTASGRPAASTWSPATANSLTRSYVFDARGLLSSRHGAGRHQGYEYDAAGQLTQHADWTMTLQLVCEDEQRLNCHSEVSLDTTAVQGYAYDPVGNRTDAGASLEAGTNRYGAFNGWTLQYDLDGNLTAKTAAGSAGGSYQYTWDSEGQLTGSNLNGIGWVSYGYNAFGQRVRRTSPVGAVQRYLYDGDDLLMELDAAGDPVREYTYYPGVDLPHSVRQNGQTYYYALEYPGHVAGLVTAAGQVVNRYEYTPFGKTLSMTEGVPNPLQYMARELDSDAGLYYVRNRWYDPALERFVSEDPIGLAGGPNLYGYAGNSPTNLRDPSGLCVTGWYSVSAYHVDLGGHVDLGRAYVLCTLYSRQAAEAMEAAAAGFREMYAHPNPGPAVAAGGTGQQAPADWKSCALSFVDASFGVASDVTMLGGVGLVVKGARGAMAARASMAAVKRGVIRVGRGRVKRQYPQLMKGAWRMVGQGMMEEGYGGAIGLADFPITNSDENTSIWKLVPIVGTVLSIVEAGRNCGDAIRATF